ncbi:MAG: cytochrome ubiquinol oxidase subunit I, partial [Deltaproteobacteria bacterium]|nr:cytochrome ubiquinol oxidase subunit I [Deltaproteobacteria bacterium]
MSRIVSLHHERTGELMTDILFARWQMGVSLGFHIVFAAVGIAMPALMVMAEIAWRRTGDRVWLDIARRWAKGTAVFFAVGAVSGTVLSFELGLLFPGFMEQAGPIVGLPFSLEGFAFFTEAIFLGLYLYGWDRLRPALHVFAGVMVAISGAASAVFVTFVNAWMNAPRGYELVDGNIVAIDPYAALSTPFALHEIPHTLLAAYLTTSLAVAGIHAWGLRRSPGNAFHAKALRLAILMTIPCALLQPVIGHFAGQQVATYQPLKFAAIEGLERTQAGAPIKIGPIEIPGMLSWLATGDPDAVVIGLDQFPEADHPPSIVQVSFRVMVALGGAMVLYALVALWRRVRRRSWTEGRWWLRAAIALAPTGVIAMEAGWIVTEVGRQPWTVYGVLRTSDAATPLGMMWIPFAAFTGIYL